jgi:hypothetical protein
LPRDSEARAGRYIAEGQCLEIARQGFIRATQAVCPEFLNELREQVFPSHDRSVALAAWASKFKVEREAWMLAGAKRTFRLWRSDTNLLKQPWLGASMRAKWKTEETFPPPLTAWDPAEESLDKWTIRAQRCLEDYGAATRKRAEACSYRNVAPGWRVRDPKVYDGDPTARGQAKKQQWETDLEWLALYHLRGWSVAEIVKSGAKVSPENVSDGIDRAYKETQIVRRPGRAGRSPK